eukprot:gene21091-25323_t
MWAEALETLVVSRAALAFNLPAVRRRASCGAVCTVFIQTAKAGIDARSGKARRRSTPKSPTPPAADRNNPLEKSPDRIISPASPGSTSRAMLAPEVPSAVSDTAPQLDFRQEVEEHVVGTWRRFKQQATARKQERLDDAPQMRASSDVPAPTADDADTASESNSDLREENVVDRAPGAAAADHDTSTNSFSK